MQIISLKKINERHWKAGAQNRTVETLKTLAIQSIEYLSMIYQFSSAYDWVCMRIYI